MTSDLETDSGADRSRHNAMGADHPADVDGAPPPTGSGPLAATDMALAEGFARQVRHWASTRGAAAPAVHAVAAAARAVSLATSAGHVCLDLAGWLAEADGAQASAGPVDPPADPARLARWRGHLLVSGLVGTPLQPAGRPMILDDENRLYLHRYFDFERRLAQRLVRGARPAGATGAAMDAKHADLHLDQQADRHEPGWANLPPADVQAAAPGGAPPAAAGAADPAAMATMLAALFKPHAAATAGGGAPDWQMAAAALSLRGRLTVISGGPGTGKTTTVVNLLACLLARQPGARIVMAAPTGKAAARLSEALRQRAGHLPADLRDRLPAESFTVHRLLGVRPQGSDAGPGGPFVHHAGHRLALDVLVVDEASMLDLALATRLLEAVPDSARIVLLGDKDQLAAVESGAVFAELSADPSLSEACRADLGALCGLDPARIQPATPVRPSALVDSVVWFDRNFRFAADSGIGRLAADTVAGRAAAALAWLRAGADASVRWLDDDSQALPAATRAAIEQGFAPYLAALRSSAAPGPGHADAPARLTAAFGAFRVLCAVQAGPRGVAAVNALVSQSIVQALADAGRPAGAGIAAPGPASTAGTASASPREARSPWFAGRPVMVLRNDPGLKLFNGDIGITLPGADGALQVYFPGADGGFRAVAPLRLPPHQTAFAMTVHKSQGSEFTEVLVLLPSQRSRVLSRELLYTAITRARERVWLAGSAPVVAAAITTNTRRLSGLQARLREAMDAATR